MWNVDATQRNPKTGYDFKIERDFTTFSEAMAFATSDAEIMDTCEYSWSITITRDDFNKGER